MKLDINTNGSWRTVLRGLSRHDQESNNHYLAARQAAHTLAYVSSELERKPITWRLVSEANDQVIERCSAAGWVDAYHPESGE